MVDKGTIETYNKQAHSYIKCVSRQKADEDLTGFMTLLPKGAKILDWGCGPANSAAMMKADGFDVTATDASSEMVKLAQEKFDIDVKLESFDALDDNSHFDGIWANFSLLHAKRSEMEAHLTRAYRALKAGGVFHLGLKLGDGEKRDRLNRFYTYYQEDEILNLLQKAEFSIIEKRQGEFESLTGDIEPFIIILARKILMRNDD